MNMPLIIDNIGEVLAYIQIFFTLICFLTGIIGVFPQK
jgi:hypothetical protein